MYCFKRLAIFLFISGLTFTMVEPASAAFGLVRKPTEEELKKFDAETVELVAGLRAKANQAAVILPSEKLREAFERVKQMSCPTSQKEEAEALAELLIDQAERLSISEVDFSELLPLVRELLGITTEHCSQTPNMQRLSWRLAKLEAKNAVKELEKADATKNAVAIKESLKNVVRTLREVWERLQEVTELDLEARRLCMEYLFTLVSSSVVSGRPALMEQLGPMIIEITRNYITLPTTKPKVNSERANMLTRVVMELLTDRQIRALIDGLSVEIKRFPPNNAYFEVVAEQIFTLVSCITKKWPKAASLKEPLRVLIVGLIRSYITLPTADPKVNSRKAKTLARAGELLSEQQIGELIDNLFTEAEDLHPSDASFRGLIEQIALLGAIKMAPSIRSYWEIRLAVLRFLAADQQEISATWLDLLQQANRRLFKVPIDDELKEPYRRRIVRAVTEVMLREILNGTQEWTEEREQAVIKMLEDPNIRSTVSKVISAVRGIIELANQRNARMGDFSRQIAESVAIVNEHFGTVSLPWLKQAVEKMLERLLEKSDLGTIKLLLDPKGAITEILGGAKKANAVLRSLVQRGLKVTQALIVELQQVFGPERFHVAGLPRSRVLVDDSLVPKVFRKAGDAIELRSPMEVSGEEPTLARIGVLLKELEDCGDSRRLAELRCDFAILLLQAAQRALGAGNNGLLRSLLAEVRLLVDNLKDPKRSPVNFGNVVQQFLLFRLLEADYALANYEETKKDEELRHAQEVLEDAKRLLRYLPSEVRARFAERIKVLASHAGICQSSIESNVTKIVEEQYGQLLSLEAEVAFRNRQLEREQRETAVAREGKRIAEERLSQSYVEVQEAQKRQGEAELKTAHVEGENICLRQELARIREESRTVDKISRDGIETLEQAAERRGRNEERLVLEIREQLVSAVTDYDDLRVRELFEKYKQICQDQLRIDELAERISRRRSEVEFVIGRNLDGFRSRSDIDPERYLKGICRVEDVRNSRFLTAWLLVRDCFLRLARGRTGQVEEKELRQAKGYCWFMLSHHSSGLADSDVVHEEGTREEVEQVRQYIRQLNGQLDDLFYETESDFGDIGPTLEELLFWLGKLWLKANGIEIELSLPEALGLEGSGIETGRLRLVESAFCSALRDLAEVRSGGEPSLEAQLRQSRQREAEAQKAREKAVEEQRTATRDKESALQTARKAIEAKKEAEREAKEKMEAADAAVLEAEQKAVKAQRVQKEAEKAQLEAESRANLAEEKVITALKAKENAERAVEEANKARKKAEEAEKIALAAKERAEEDAKEKARIAEEAKKIADEATQKAQAAIAAQRRAEQEAKMANEAKEEAERALTTAREEIELTLAEKKIADETAIEALRRAKEALRAKEAAERAQEEMEEANSEAANRAKEKATQRAAELEKTQSELDEAKKKVEELQGRLEAKQKELEQARARAVEAEMEGALRKIPAGRRFSIFPYITDLEPDVVDNEVAAWLSAVNEARSAAPERDLRDIWGEVIAQRRRRFAEELSSPEEKQEAIRCLDGLVLVNSPQEALVWRAYMLKNSKTVFGEDGRELFRLSDSGQIKICQDEPSLINGSWAEFRESVRVNESAILRILKQNYETLSELFNQVRVVNDLLFLADISGSRSVSVFFEVVENRGVALKALLNQNFLNSVYRRVLCLMCQINFYNLVGSVNMFNTLEQRTEAIYKLLAAFVPSEQLKAYGFDVIIKVLDSCGVYVAQTENLREGIASFIAWCEQLVNGIITDVAEITKGYLAVQTILQILERMQEHDFAEEQGRLCELRDLLAQLLRKNSDEVRRMFTVFSDRMFTVISDRDVGLPGWQEGGTKEEQQPNKQHVRVLSPWTESAEGSRAPREDVPSRDEAPVVVVPERESSEVATPVEALVQSSMEMNSADVEHNSNTTSTAQGVSENGTVPNALNGLGGEVAVEMSEEELADLLMSM